MTRLDDLQRKREDAQFEITVAQEGLKRSQQDVQVPPVPTPSVGPLVSIGGRECRSGDFNTVHRLWKEYVWQAKKRLRAIDAEIAKAQRSK